MAFRRIEDIQAWQVARRFKVGIYDLTNTGGLALDKKIREQLREAAASAASNISEGFGRFDPADFGRLVEVARASIVECRNHLIDAVDRGHISESIRTEHDAVAQQVLKETAGLIDYLQSPEAKRNAERIRQRRIERRRARRNEQP